MVSLDDIADAWSTLPTPPPSLTIDIEIEPDRVILDARSANRWLWLPLLIVAAVCLANLVWFIPIFTGHAPDEKPNIPTPYVVGAIALLTGGTFCLMAAHAAFMAHARIYLTTDTLTVGRGPNLRLGGAKGPYQLDQLSRAEAITHEHATELLITLGQPHNPGWFKNVKKTTAYLHFASGRKTQLFQSLEPPDRTWLVVVLNTALDLVPNTKPTDNI